MCLKERKVTCSCPQAKLLLAQASSKKCWHIMFMQYRQKEIDQMEFCVDSSMLADAAAEYVCFLFLYLVFIYCREDDMQEEEELLGHTRAGHAFSMCANSAVVTTKLVKQIFKIPGCLQWLVVEKHGYCWVFFSRYQQRFKCRCQHPNNPGMLFCTPPTTALGDCPHNCSGRSPLQPPWAITPTTTLGDGAGRSPSQLPWAITPATALSNLMQYPTNF